MKPTNTSFSDVTEKAVSPITETLPEIHASFNSRRLNNLPPNAGRTIHQGTKHRPFDQQTRISVSTIASSAPRHKNALNLTRFPFPKTNTPTARSERRGRCQQTPQCSRPQHQPKLPSWLLRSNQPRVTDTTWAPFRKTDNQSSSGKWLPDRIFR